MRFLVLGSAAGGGLPQWNCLCENCRLAYANSPRIKRRSQASLAVSADGEDWMILSATPDLRQQIIDNPALHPKSLAAFARESRVRAQRRHRQYRGPAGDARDAALHLFRHRSRDGLRERGGVWRAQRRACRAQHGQAGGARRHRPGFCRHPLRDSGKSAPIYRVGQRGGDRTRRRGRDTPSGSKSNRAGGASITCRPARA